MIRLPAVERRLIDGDENHIFFVKQMSEEKRDVEALLVELRVCVAVVGTLLLFETKSELFDHDLANNRLAERYRWLLIRQVVSNAVQSHSRQSYRSYGTGNGIDVCAAL